MIKIHKLIDRDVCKSVVRNKQNKKFYHAERAFCYYNNYRFFSFLRYFKQENPTHMLKINEYSILIWGHEELTRH